MNQFEFYLRYPLARPKAFIYAVSGEPDSFRDHIVNQIRLRHRPSDLDYQRVSVKSESQALQLLTLQPTKGHRLIEIGDFEDWTDRSYLAQWLGSRKQPNIIPVFVSKKRSPDTKNPFVQAIIQKGWWIVVRRPSYETMVAFVQDRYRLPESQAKSVVDSTGTDILRVHSLMAKLFYFTDGHVPTSDDIRTVSSGYASTVYQLVDDIIEGRKAKAISLIDASATVGLLTLLQKRVSTLIVVRQLSQRGEQAQEISERAGVPLFLVGGIIERSESISFERAARLLGLIAEADADVTVRGYNLQTVLYRLILQA